MRCPAEVYQNSNRKYAGSPQELIYSAIATRNVNGSGQISWQAQQLFITTSLAGWSVGLKSTALELIEVWFARLRPVFCAPITARSKPMRPTNPKAPSAVDAPSAPLRLLKLESGINGLRPLAPRRVPSIYSVSALSRLRSALQTVTVFCVWQLFARSSLQLPNAKAKSAGLSDFLI
jgi:hypothetical protein